MEKTKIFFKNSIGQKLTGVLYKPENKKDFPIAIFCHGYKSTKESNKAKAISEKLTKKGIGIFAFDFSGNGESEGEFKKTTITQGTNIFLQFEFRFQYQNRYWNLFFMVNTFRVFIIECA